MKLNFGAGGGAWWLAIQIASTRSPKGDEGAGALELTTSVRPGFMA